MSPRAPHRFYFAGHLDPNAQAIVELSEDESHHLLRVLRLRVGTQIDLFDARGQAYSADVVGEREGRVSVRLLMPIEQEPASQIQVNLAVSVIKRRPMDLMIEKLSELGVDTFQPLLASRSIGQGDIKPYSDPPERWARLAITAAKQCGRNCPLEIMPPSPLKEWLARPRPPAHAFFAHLANESKLLGQAIGERASAALPIWVAIGPEGGWTPQEIEAFMAAGFQPVSLGSLTLRAETAAMAAAAVCRLS